MKAFKLIICIVIGYLLGSLSPSALFGKLKGKNLRKQGTGNLGATNTMFVLGKKFGIAVMILDMIKAILAVNLAKLICPSYAFAGIAAGSACVVGHIFPVFLKFKGGKGLAPYGGMVLALDPLLFLCLLTLCIIVTLIVNYGIAVPFVAGVLFPIISFWRVESRVYLIIAIAVSLLLIIRHIPNIFRITRGEEIKVRDYLTGKHKNKA
ncbi:MAG: glycerol-3-phosphate 1-O-acyltransferase PlsY [Clostridia bacterium]|nr:glycerol-3-phosphate 1-O-acyltransferase PlsY [Clostridia bacterium]